MAELPPRLNVPNKDAKFIIIYGAWFLFCLYLKFINHWLLSPYYQQTYFIYFKYSFMINLNLISFKVVLSKLLSKFSANWQWKF